MLPQIPQVSDQVDLQDTIRTTFLKPPKDRRKAVPGQFDTILAFKKAGSKAFEDSSNPLKGVSLSISLSKSAPLLIITASSKGLSVAQVRAIFKLLPEYRHFDMPLAYVEWYTPLQTYIPSLEMYQISCSNRNRYRRALIIPVNQIVQSCHFIPKFGTKIGRMWNAKNVLELADTYYLNPDLSLHNFVLLRYMAPNSDD